MSFWKNTLTFGKYNKLQSEECDFNILSEKFDALQTNFYLLNEKRFQALKFLKTERSEVVKNLSLSKTLISKIKTISKDKAQVIKSDLITNIENNNIEFKLGDISIDFQGKLDDVSEAFVASLGGSLERIENKKTYSKKDLQVEFATIAFGAAIKGVENVIGLNSEVNERRRHISNTTSNMQDAIKKMTTQAPKIYSESKRIIEIARTLNQHNKAFSGKYASIQKEINKKSKFLIFINEVLGKKIIPDENMQVNLHVLMQFSSEYNKFNNTANL